MHCPLKIDIQQQLNEYLFFSPPPTDSSLLFRAPAHPPRMSTPSLPG